MEKAENSPSPIDIMIAISCGPQPPMLLCINKQINTLRPGKAEKLGILQTRIFVSLISNILAVCETTVPSISNSELLPSKPSAMIHQLHKK